MIYRQEVTNLIKSRDLQWPRYGATFMLGFFTAIIGCIIQTCAQFILPVLTLQVEVQPHEVLIVTFILIFSLGMC